MVRNSSSPRPPREGVILVVVVSLLALFAVVGLGYVIYAESAATMSRLSREGQVYVDERAGLDLNVVLNQALGALIYDKPDDPTGIYSALRGHSLARSMYGYNPPQQLISPVTGQPFLFNPNTTAFSGTGRLRNAGDISGVATFNIVNYVPWRTDPVTGNNPIVRMPEQYPTGAANSPNSYRKLTDVVNGTNPQLYRYFGGANAPYTYPDQNNMYLGAVRASDGVMLSPSFHRPFLFHVNGDPNQAIDPQFLSNPTHLDWYRPSGRYKLLRPRPIDQLTQSQIAQLGLPYPPPENITQVQANQYAAKLLQFINQGRLMPFPTDAGGDVKNLLGAPGGNDSIWMDIGMPVYATRGGKKYKPLVAFLITDLDGRINLNVHGNLNGAQVPPALPLNQSIAGYSLHASNQGLGRWEVNPLHVFPQKILAGNVRAQLEYQNLFTGANNVAGRINGSTTPSFPQPLVRVGPGRFIDFSNFASSFLNPPMVNQMDVAAASTANAVIVYTGASYPPASGPVQLSPYNPAGSGVQFPPDFSIVNAANTPAYMAIDFDGRKIGPIGVVRSDSVQAWAYQSPAPGIQGYPLTLSSFPDYYTGAAPNTKAGYENECERDFVMQPTAPGNPIIYSMPNLAAPIPASYQHPSLYNPLRNTGTSRQLDAMEMHSIIGRYNSPIDLGETLLNRLLPNNLNVPAFRQRITLVSADVGRAGLMPQTLQRVAGQPSAWGFNSATYGGAEAPFALQGEDFANFTALTPYSVAPPQPCDYLGSQLATFNLGVDPTTNPPIASGARLRIADASGNSLATLDGRSFAADVSGRLDLNRPLTPYPPINPTNGSYQGNLAEVQARVDRADNDRREFASDIFERLRKAVGAPPLNPLPAPNTDEYKALKWLAQLAVNIVDDIDDDEIMTRFEWTNSNPPDFVWGVELPKVVINEAYVEQTNGEGNQNNFLSQTSVGPPPKYKANKYQFNVWVELHHSMVPPFRNNGSDPQETKDYNNFVNRHSVWLLNGNNESSYRVVVCDTASQATTELNNLNPYFGINVQPADFSGAMGEEKVIRPVDTDVGTSKANAYKAVGTGSQRNRGFYLLGPNYTGTLHGQAATNTSTGMEPTFKAQQGLSLVTAQDMATVSQIDGYTGMNPLPSPKIVLQRLANPYRPHHATFNPYITVDQMAPPPKVTFNGTPYNTVNRAIEWNGSSQQQTVGARQSFGRRQPFAGSTDDQVAKFVPLKGGASDPKNAFHRHNANSGDNPPTALPEPATSGGTLDRFDWLVHHDRKLTSPVELIHVAGVAPWEVTEKFIHKDAATNQIVRQGHTAPWLDEREPNDQTQAAQKVKFRVGTGAAAAEAHTRLYRALEVFRVGDRTVEMAFGGRDIGKVNINTIWDREVFRAVCDGVVRRYQTSPGIFVDMLDSKAGFTQLDVDWVWEALTDGTKYLTARTQGLSLPGLGYGKITGEDLPFWGAGAAHWAPGPQSQRIPTNLPNPYPAAFQNAGIDATLFRSILPRNAMDPSNPKRPRIFDSESQFQTTPSPGTEFGTNQTIPGNNMSPVRHPLLEKSLVSKIFEHLTTRSNVFAVYMTVGYFEVLDDKQKPELLGDEIGMLRDATGTVAENKTVRHRMFAIVDRTNLTLQPPVFNGAQLVGEDVQRQGPTPFYYSSSVLLRTAPNATVPPSNTQFWTVDIPIESFTTLPTNQLPTQPPNPTNVTSVTGKYNGISWTLQPNNVVYVGAGTEQRQLIVRQIGITWPKLSASNQPVYTATLVLGVPPVNAAAASGPWPSMDAPPPHPVLITNVIAGNPGPQPDFDHRAQNYRAVVLYSVILD